MIDWIKILIDVAQFLLMGGIGIYIHLVNKNDATKDRIDKVEREGRERYNNLNTVTDDRLDNHESRISKIEGLLNQAPTHDDIGQVHERVNELATAVAGISAMTAAQTEILKAIQGRLEMINNYLLNQR